VCTLLEKNLSTGTRFKQVILKGFFTDFPNIDHRQKIHQPSNDILVDLGDFGQIPGPKSSLFGGRAAAAAAAAAFVCHYYFLRT
jgi:hypothetical protein